MSAYALWLGGEALATRSRPDGDGASASEGRIWSLPPEARPFTEAVAQRGGEGEVVGGAPP